MEVLSEILSGIGKMILSIWWFWLTIILGWVFISLWLAWRQFLFKAAVTWTLLEIQIPREIKKSPRAMEHILTNFATLGNSPGNFREKWWDGEVPQWFSLEVVSFGGDIHFYIRTPSRHRNVVESSIYAQYSDVEIKEVGDYTDRCPKTVYDLYKTGYDLWGAELVLGKGNAYPIRTYLQFESDVEERNLDPIAGLLEVLSKLKPDEIVMVQILSRPALPGWGAVIEKEVAQLKRKYTFKVQKASGVTEEEIKMTPGETELVKQIEMRAFRPAFECMIRYVYFAPQSIYNVNFAKRGVRGAFFQYSAPNLNYFAPNPRTWTQAWIWDRPHIFPSRILQGRKQRMLTNYRERSFPAETFMGKLIQFRAWSSSFTQKYFLLNVEELATIYHLPTAVVLTQPLVKRVESKRIGPPAGLPIFQDEQGLPGLMREE